jgi:carboxymethylenebutenolidase
MAKRLADKGFTVLLPNLFFRFARNAPDGFQPDDAEEQGRVIQKLFASLTPTQMDSDGAAYADFLMAQPQTAPGKIGVVGHCFTGQMALRVAAVRADMVASAASFHGGWLATDAPESPHLLLPRIKARLYFGHADNDSLMPGEWIDRLEAALRDWHGAFQSEVYKGAQHGWTAPGRDVYNELQAERAFEKEVELFESTLQ